MAEEKVIEINVDASQANKSLNKFGGTLEDVYGEGVQPLNFAIGELEDRLYEMAAAGEQGTQEFADMAKEVAKMKKVIIDTDAAVDGLAEGVGTHLGGAIQGVAGGFALAQGVMGAFGADSKALEETLLKVQSAMAIADGIQSVREGIRAFKALKVAAMSNIVVQQFLNVVMSLNPVGLIVLGVTALGAAIYALWEPIKQLLQLFGLMADDSLNAAEASEELAKSYEKAQKALEKFRKQAERDHKHTMDMLQLEQEARIRSLERDGATTEEINEEKRKQIQETHDLTIKNMQVEQAMREQEIVRTSGYIKNQSALYKKALKDEEFDDAKAIRERIEKEREKLETLRFERDNYHKDVEQAEGQHNANLDKLSDQQVQAEKQRLKERLDAWKEFQKNRLDAAREIQDLELDLIDDADRQKLAKRKSEYERELEDLKANTTRTQEEKGRLENLLTEQYNRDRANIILEIEKKLEEELLPVRDAGINNHEQKELAKTEISKYNAEQRAAAEKKLIEVDAEVLNAKLQMTSDVFGAINDLTQAFAKDDEQSARRAFNINKAVGIAQAVISTAQAVVAQLAVPQDALTGANFIKAGIVAATGAAQIATIARTQFQGASGGGSAPSVGSVPSASAASPTFNVVGDTGVNQLAQSLGNQQNQPIEAYVVANNVTTAQDLERSKIESASL